MTKSDSLQQQISDYEAKLEELRQQQTAERKGERLEAINAARELIKNHGLTASDLGLTGKGGANKKSGNDKRNAVAPKYMDPASGKTWTGRGKSPVWLSTQIVAGKSKLDFLIKS